MRLRSRLLAALVAAALVPAAAPAQIRASEIGSVAQIVDGTKIALQYSRPRARGRSPLFGDKVVRWNETWTPGANGATTFDVSKDITLDGHRVAKGIYSVWMVVRKSGEWTVVFDPDAKRFHMDPPDSNATQLRLPVRVEEAPFLDVLTWSFPELRMDGGTLAMQWGTTRVAMHFTVQPTLDPTLSAADAQPYLGRYVYTQSGPGGDTRTFTVTYEKGTMKAEFDPTIEWMGKFAMIRIAPDWFVPGLYDEHGAIYEVLRPDMTFEFTRVNGQATTFDARLQNDAVIASGKRAP